MRNEEKAQSWINRNSFLLWSEHTVELLLRQRFNPKAREIYDIHPLGIFRWTDELPEEWGTLGVVNLQDRSLVSRLFEIRNRFWETGTMTDEDEFFWKDAQSRFPDWPIFLRLHISDDEKARMAELRESSW
jgi:hypothetical protein